MFLGSARVEKRALKQTNKMNSCFSCIGKRKALRVYIVDKEIELSSRKFEEQTRTAVVQIL